jgi:hypothetical protein
MDRKMELEGWASPPRDMIFRSLWKPVTDVKSAKGYWEHLCGGFSRYMYSKRKSKAIDRSF